MRWLLRSLIFWAISLPVFYIFVLPLLLDKLGAKASAEAFSQCNEHMKQEMAAAPGLTALTPAVSDQYCHCVSDGLIFSKADLRDAIKHQPPAALTALAAAKATQCNESLQQALEPPPQPISLTPDGIAP